MKFARTILAVSIAVACGHASAIQPVDPGVAVGSGTHAVATDPLLQRAFVANRDSGTVSIVDLARASSIADVPVGANPVAVIENAATGRLYVLTDISPGSLSVLDAASGEQLTRIAVGDHPQGMAADFKRGHVYVSNAGGDSLSIVNFADNSVVTTVPVGRVPHGVAVDAARARIYVANTLDATLTVVDQDSLAVIGTVAVGRNPGIPVVDALTGRVFVNAVDDRAVSLVDGATLSVVAVIPSGSAAAGGSFSPVYRKLYLASPADDSVTVIDVDSATVSATLRVGGSPQEVSVDDDAGTLYVPNRDNASVSVIDPQHEQVMGSLRVGAFPSRIALHGLADRLFVVGDREDATDMATFTTRAKLVPDTAIAVEYLAPASGRYFHTADAIDRRLLEDGALGRSWQPTQQYWRVWTAPQPDRVAVCWIGGAGAGGMPLFVAGAKCSALRAAHDGSEIAVYYVASPDASGACAPGTEPLYRLDSDRGFGAPRLTPDRAVRDAMRASGWVAQGAGFDATYACTPSLRASVVDGFVPPDMGQPPTSRIPYPIGPVPRPKAFADELAAAATISRPGIPLHMNQL